MKQRESNTKWIVESFIITFILSGIISSNGVASLNIGLSIVILIAVILIGIMFDVIGVAVTVANEDHFHAKATKKAEGSKSSLKLIKNAAKVANFCADVIGDICGVISGSISMMITLKIISIYGVNSNIQYAISALVAALTVSGKAIGKGIATRNSTAIVDRVGKVLGRFEK